MLRQFLLWFCVVAAMLISGCGGGGGGGSVTLTGLVRLVSNGGAPVNPASVQAGNSSVLTASDGSFSVLAGRGTAFVLVTYTPTGSATPVTFRFDFPAAQVNTDLGDLFIGPTKISATGKVVTTTDGSGVSGATILLGGRSGLSGTDGTFTISDVAYDPASPGGFFSLEGRAGKAGFFTRVFNPESEPVGGSAALGDIPLQPDTGDQPPSTPQTIAGNVRPLNLADGAIVELLQGTTVVRRQTVSTTATYGFWVPVGAYTVKVYRPAAPTNANTYPVTLTAPTQVVKQDVTVP